MANIAVEGSKPSALLEGPEQKEAPKSPLIVRVAKEFGVSPFRQMRETFSLRFGANKLRPSDYYDFSLFDPAIPMEEKRQYVGVTGNERLNQRLSPPDLIPTGAFVGNKVLYAALLNQMGLAATETQAIASLSGSFGTLPVLRDAAALEKFLLEDAVYPLFGKPRHGSLSEGSVRIDRVSGRKVCLGNGSEHDVSSFCAEVFAKFPGGFLLQSALIPHPDMASVTGDAIGCVRVVTVNDTGASRPLYALWKIPSPKAMSDNFWQEGSMIAALDLETGKVLSCRRGTGMDSEDVTAHPSLGAPIVGKILPHWQNVKALAADAHALFPEFGVCGFDIAICADGPRIIECNDNPFHTLYQLANRKGIANRDLQPVWDAVAARQQEQLRRHRAASAQVKSPKG